MATYRSVEFVSRSEAMSRTPDADTIVISIHNSFGEVQKLKDGWKDVLVQQFDDVDSVMNSRYKRFSMTQAEEIIAFLRKYENSITHVLVHCMAGEVRSAAVAKIVARMYDLSFPANYDKHQRWVTRVLERVLRLAPEDSLRV